MALPTISGTNGADIVTGSAGSDTLIGFAENDRLFGLGGADLLIGGNGNDLLDGGAGADQLIGGIGDDIYVIDHAGDRIAEGFGGGKDKVLSSVPLDLSADWASEIEDLTYTGAVAVMLVGNSLSNLITSLSSAADNLLGGVGNDTLAGGGGADTLSGGEGDDYYRIGAGDVVVEAAGQGRDTFEGLRTSIASGPAASTIENLIFTGAGTATLTGNGLGNLIEGGSGANTVNGGLGDDSLAGGNGADFLNGGVGNDCLFGGMLSGLSLDQRYRLADRSIDQMAGGVGNDTYFISDSDDIVLEAEAEGSLDVVVSTVSSQIARYANVEALILEDRSAAYSAVGGSAGDLLIGNSAENLISGGLGDDTLWGWGLMPGRGVTDLLLGGAGNDIMIARGLVGPTSGVGLSVDGGAGDDLYVIGSNVAISGWDRSGIDTAVIHGTVSLSQLSGIERIYLYGATRSPDGTVRDAMIKANAALTRGEEFDATTLEAGLNASGNALANAMFGNGLGNRLSGAAGSDTIDGAGGNDTLIGGAGTDHLIGGAGDDTFQIDTGDLATERANSGFDVISSSTLTTNAAFGAYANIEGWLYTGTGSVNLHRGSMNTSADLIGGGAGHDTLSGFGGDDTLIGGFGDDDLFGGSGADSLAGDGGNDSLVGGDQDDLIAGGIGADLLAGDLGDDTLDGGFGNDTINGGGNWDSLRGSQGDDLISGDAGQDTMEGGGGNDILYGGQNSDRIVGGGGNDVIYFGEVSIDRIVSGDHLFGDDPEVLGVSGKDEFRLETISSGSAATETYTGSGEFQFAGGATIGDFGQGSDRIGISATLVGDFDGSIDGSSEVNSGDLTFSATDEIVFFRTDAPTSFSGDLGAVFSPINVAALTAILVTADAAIGVGETRIIVLDDGTDSALFFFQSVDGNSAISIDELYLAAVVTGAESLQRADFFVF